MNTYILPWTRFNNLFLEDEFFRTMRNIDWGDIEFSFVKKTSATSGDNFYVVRTGTGMDGIVAKGFFISDPYRKRTGDPYYTIAIRPTFMMSWKHEKDLLHPYDIKNAVPEFPDIGDGEFHEISDKGAMKLNAIWDYYTSQLDEEDFGDSLAVESGRPEADIEDAILLAAQELYDETSFDGSRPAILKALEALQTGKTEEEQIIGILKEVYLISDISAGELRNKGFSEKIVDSVAGPGQIVIRIKS